MYDTASSSYGQGYSNQYRKSYLHKLPIYQKNKDVETMRKITTRSSDEYGYFWNAKTIREQREERERADEEEKRMNVESRLSEYQESEENPFEKPEKLFFPKIRAKPRGVIADVERAAGNYMDSVVRANRTTDNTPILPDIQYKSQNREQHKYGGQTYGNSVEYSKYTNENLGYADEHKGQRIYVDEEHKYAGQKHDRYANEHPEYADEHYKYTNEQHPYADEQRKYAEDETRYAKEEYREYGEDQYKYSDKEHRIYDDQNGNVSGKGSPSRDSVFGKRIRQIQMVFEDDSIVTIPAHGEEFRGVIPRVFRQYLYQGNG